MTGSDLDRGSRAHPGLVVAAWVIAAAVVAALIGVIVLSWGVIGPNSARVFATFDAVWLCSWVGFPLVGATIITRRPASVLAWLLLGVSASVVIGVFAGTLLEYQVLVAQVDPTPALIWLAAWSFVPGFALAPFVIDRFPADRPAAGRWRWLVRGAAVVAAVDVVAHAVRPKVVHGSVEPAIVLDNPAYRPAFGTIPDTVIIVAGYALVALFLAVIVRAVVRYRRAEGLERAQRKWFAAALCVFPLGFALVFLLDPRLPPEVVNGLVAITFFTTLNGSAAAILIAVTRYRLYEIDRLVSRSVTYVVLTIALAAVYAAGVLGIGARVPRGSSDLVVAGSTLVVAALFQPARHHVQRWVDRRFNRARYDAALAVTAFGASLRDEVDLARLADELGDVVGRTLHPSRVSLWLPGTTS